MGGLGRDRQTETGRLVAGQRSGRWVIQQFDGSVWEGPFLDGKTNGTWVIRRANGTVEEWTFRDGERVRFNLLARTTALDNVELPLLYGSRLNGSARHARSREMLHAVGLGDRMDHFPNQLSGGQQQRVAIARALVNEPAILLADEPTGNLDSRTSIKVMDIVQRLNEESGITVLLITHEADMAEYGKRLIRFHDGTVASDRVIAMRRAASEELAALPPADTETAAA